MLRQLPTVIEPETWTLAFHKTSPYRLVRWLALGRYKHVSAFAWVAPLDLWVVYDITLGGTKLRLLPDSDTAKEWGAAKDWLVAHTRDADLVVVNRIASSRPPVMPFYCVSAIKSLIGLRSGALLPTSLWRHVVANGGKIIHGSAGTTVTGAQPGDAGRAAAGAG